MSATIRFDISDPAIKAKLANLPQEMLKHAEEALLKQAELIKGLAQVYVPVDTGSLRDSIRIERGGQSMNWRQIRVRAGGYVTNPKTGRKVDYAIHQEYGTRYNYGHLYMTRAAEEVRPTIADMIRHHVVEGV